ncbi:oxidoreductase-like domain-containing protein [Herbaspirillum chlorophenolicum]|uniref:oxidoreductase-like domain-containing protein n=1 Tax=Herbaspirillum chlorophenolicum TaxID=211589 RepID=UPI00067D1A59|nr:oxidoreductase-like domain-containing protein [Herbaspirillum chlorophenolicum]
MNSGKSAQQDTASQIDDPAPVPPIEPELEDCCGNGCVPCIFDIYEQARERYLEQLDAWNQRQAERAAMGKKPRGKDRK